MASQLVGALRISYGLWQTLAAAGGQTVEALRAQNQRTKIEQNKTIDRRYQLSPPISMFHCISYLFRQKIGLGKGWALSGMPRHRTLISLGLPHIPTPGIIA